MKRSSTAAWLVAGVLACSTDPSFDISGSWILTETLTSEGISCVIVSDLTLTLDTGVSSFTGQRTITSQTCTGAPQGFVIAATSNVLGGEIRASDTAMEINACMYDGRFESAVVQSGSVTCPNGLGQVTVAFSGTWRATR